MVWHSARVSIVGMLRVCLSFLIDEVRKWTVGFLISNVSREFFFPPSVLCQALGFSGEQGKVLPSPLLIPHSAEGGRQQTDKNMKLQRK